MVLTGRQVRMASLKMLLFSRGNAYKNAEYIRKQGIFYHMGEGCYYHPRKLPSEPMLVSVGDNVWIASNVRFVTHDMSGNTYLCKFLILKSYCQLIDYFHFF